MNQRGVRPRMPLRRGEVLAACIFIALTLTSAALQRKPAAPQTKAQQQQQKAGTARPVVEVKPSVKQGTGSKDQQKHADASADRKERQKSFGDWFSGVWTFEERIGVATLTVTTLFLIFTILTWLAMLSANKHAEKVYEKNERDGEDDRRLTRESNDATMRAVQASENQLAAIIKVTKANVTVINVPGFNIDTPPDLVTVVMRNGGFSPAHNVQAWIRATCNNSPEFSELLQTLPPKAYDFTPDKIASLTTIGANQVFELRAGLGELSGEQWQRIRSGTLWLFVLGWVTYQDIFDGARVLTYSARYNPSDGGWIAGDAYNEQTERRD